MERKRPSPWTYVVLGALATMVAQAFGRFAYPLMLTAIQGDLGLSYTISGSLASANLVAYMIGSVAVTWLAGRLQPARMVHLGLIISVGALGLISIAANAWVIGIGLFIAGFAGAIIWVPAPLVGSALLDPKHKGLGFGLVGSGIGIGVVLSGLAAAHLRADLGDAAWRTMYRGEFLIGLVFAVAIVLWLKPVGTKVGGKASLDAIRTVPNWKWLLAAYAAFGASYILVATYLVAMLEDDRAFDPVAASQMFLILGAGTVVGGPGVGKVSDLIGRPRTMVYAMAGMSIAALIIRWGPGWSIIPAAIVFGLGFSGVPTALGAYTGDHTTPEGFSAAFGVATLAFGMAQMITPQVGGILADRLGSFDAVFVLSSVMALAGAGAAGRLMARES